MNLDKLKTTDDIDVAGKRVIVRADLNVPVRGGKVTDATRLERVVPGLKALADRGAKVIVISHFGRPKNGPETDLSLKPVAETLQKLLGRPVSFGADSIGEKAAGAIAALKNGDVVEIQTKKNSAPSPKWLGFAKTSLARRHIKNKLGAQKAIR